MQKTICEGAVNITCITMWMHVVTFLMEVVWTNDGIHSGIVNSSTLKACCEHNVHYNVEFCCGSSEGNCEE